MLGGESWLPGQSLDSDIAEVKSEAEGEVRIVKSPKSRIKGRDLNVLKFKTRKNSV